MAFWGREDFLLRGKAEELVKPWNNELVEEAGIRLRVGAEYFTNKGDGGKISKLDLNQAFVVGSGEFVFVLTEEKLNIPKDCIGFISARATTKMQGLVNVSGFQVDPGYSGKFIFAMFNAGPKPIHLRRGEDIFCLYISDMKSKLPDDFKGTNTIKDGIEHIPTKIINSISVKALTAYQVNEKLEKIYSELQQVRERFVYLATATAVVFTMAVFFFGPELRDRFVALVTPAPNSEGD